MIDDCQAVFAGNPRATQLAERVVTTGGPAGVGLIVTARGAGLAYFGGSRILRAGLGATNRAVFGTGTEAVETPGDHRNRRRRPMKGYRLDAPATVPAMCWPRRL